MRGSRIIVATSIVAALVASGCGSDKKQADDTTTTTTAAPRTVVDAAAYDANLATFATALNSAGLITTLSGKGPFTALAPDNDAFAKMPAGRLATLLSGKKTDDLRKLLDAQIVTGNAAELAPGKLKTASGATLTVKQTGDTFTITGPDGKTVKVVGKPIVAENGLVYPVDGFLAKT
jgi:uncharacterized surface protein with fasciclin (FAS1) repeats